MRNPTISPTTIPAANLRLRRPSVGCVVAIFSCGFCGICVCIFTCGTLNSDRKPAGDVAQHHMCCTQGSLYSSVPIPYYVMHCNLLAVLSFWTLYIVFVHFSQRLRRSLNWAAPCGAGGANALPVGWLAVQCVLFKKDGRRSARLRGCWQWRSQSFTPTFLKPIAALTAT